MARSLDDGDRRELERATGGSIFRETALTARPGAVVEVRVPIGEENTAAAVTEARSLDFVEAAGRENADPSCVIADIVPPPPCPPWSLFATVGLGLGSAGATPAIEPGDELEITYLQSDGTVLTRALTVGPGE